MTVVSQRTNVAVPATPPTHYYPNQSGDALPVGGLTWALTIDSAGYADGSTADFGIEYLYSGTWIQDVAVTGWQLGSHTDKHGNITTIATIGSSIGSSASPYPSHGRIRIDSIPAGTLASLTLSIS